MDKERKFDKVVNLAKTRGFIFPSSEIYGGLNSIYDYGPLGIELKNNIKNFKYQIQLLSKLVINYELYNQNIFIKNFEMQYDQQ